MYNLKYHIWMRYSIKPNEWIESFNANHHKSSQFWSIVLIPKRANSKIMSESSILNEMNKMTPCKKHYNST